MTPGRWLSERAAITALLGLAGWLPSAGQNAKFHDAPASASRMKNPFAGQAGAAESGAKLYTRNCLSCHGRGARGTGSVPALSKGKTQAAKDGEIFWYISKGDVDSGMPSWSGLPVEQRWQIVTYLKSLGSTNAGTKPASSATAPGSPQSRSTHRRHLAVAGFTGAN